MTLEKVNRRTGRINRQGEKVLDSIQRENFTYLVVESNGGMPCPACCFQPCSIKPADLEPCVCFKNKYGKNAILKGMNLEEGATAMDRNRQIGGHKA